MKPLPVEEPGIGSASPPCSGTLRGCPELVNRLAADGPARLAGRVADLTRAEYPRSSQYDADWLLENDMGPHPLWLLEDLAKDLDLRPGLRVLDLGSGKGATSIFLAKEYGVQVWAADLWIDPTEAAGNFAKHGVEVTALKAEAHALPFALGFFDAIVCIDAYEYFGTADSYLAYITSFLKPGGQLGIATPAMTREIRDLGYIPEHIKQLVGWEAIAWHTADWWRFHWEITELVEVTSARLQESGWHDWLTWAHAISDRNGTHDPTVEMLEKDQGEYLSFALVTARKPS
jgi:SAM-dependent methyltransferase